MRARGSAAAGAEDTRGASVLIGVLRETFADRGPAGRAAAASGAAPSLGNFVPSKPQKLSLSSNLRLQVGHCFISVSSQLLQLRISSMIVIPALPVLRRRAG